MTALLSTEELGLVRLDLYGNVWPVRSTYCRTARDIAEQLAWIIRAAANPGSIDESPQNDEAIGKLTAYRAALPLDREGASLFSPEYWIVTVVQGVWRGAFEDGAAASSEILASLIALLRRHGSRMVAVGDVALARALATTLRGPIVRFMTDLEAGAISVPDHSFRTEFAHVE